MLLESITVVEFGRIFSAPLAGKILGDLGAKVIKIERKGTQDESRHYGMKLPNGESDYFRALNHNKETIELDLKDENDLKKALYILKNADVLIHNSLQKSFDKLGLSYEIVSKLNPKIIYTAVSGYGYKSVYRDNPSQDAIIQGLSGFMSLNGHADDIPLKTGVPMIDYVTGQYAVIGILAALNERHQTGKGKLVTVSLLESALGVIAIEAARYLNLNHVASRNSNRHYSIAPYNAYQTKDGYVMIAIANNEMFARFSNVLGINYDEFDSNEKRLANVDEMDRIINEKTKNYSTKDLIETLRANKISCGPINNIAQAFASPEVKELDLIEQKGEIKHLKTPINFFE